MADDPAAEEQRRLAHDLRSPLAVIEMLAGVLERDEGVSPEQRADYAGRIRRAAGEIRALLDGG
jgi:signal transduction histidine kinase